MARCWAITTCLILAARQLGQRPSRILAAHPGPAGANNGGEELTWPINGRTRGVAASRPALVLNERLLAHADATFYQVYGRTIGNGHLQPGSCCRWFRTTTQSPGTLLLDYFSQRLAFQDRVTWPGARVDRVLSTAGIHGPPPFPNSPISSPRTWLGAPRLCRWPTS